MTAAAWMGENKNNGMCKFQAKMFNCNKQMFEEHLGEICSWDVLQFLCLQSYPQQNCCMGTEGSQQHAEVVQRRAGDAFSLTRLMSLGGARGTVLGACCWHLSQPCCAQTRQRHWAAVKEQTNGQVSCGNSAVGAFLVPYCRLLDRKSLLPIWACRVICCLTAHCAESGNPMSISLCHNPHWVHWHPAQ